jgi:4a-hydroxytetrahydrobiopterin dehydratase
MSEREESVYLALTPGWRLEANGIHRLRKSYRFSSFREAVGFVDSVADVAEAEGHHPNMCVNYDVVAMEVYTHKIRGLHKNDFILAAKIDDVYGGAAAR